MFAFSFSFLFQSFALLRSSVAYCYETEHSKVR